MCPQLYRFLVRRTESNFNKVVLKRMFMSKQHRAPLSLSKLAHFMKGKVRTPAPGEARSITRPAARARARAPLLTAACVDVPALFLLIPQDNKVAVLVGTITDDVRLFEVPKLRVCALKFTETARARITKVRRAPSLYPQRGAPQHLSRPHS